MKKLFLLLVCLLFIAIILLYQKNIQDVRSRAQEVNFCQDKCINQDRCGPNGPPGDVNYNAPCCEDVKRTGNPFACPWPQRGYCTDDQCASIPPDVNRQLCGSPRHTWCNLCRQNNCPGYNDNPTPTATPIMIPTVEPTFVPQPTIPQPTPFAPTEIPTLTPAIPSPTRKPTIFPTAPAFPTMPSGKSFPTATSAPTPFILPEFSLPSFSLPKFNTNVVELNRNIRKPLGFFEYLFETIKTYDQKLEKTINDRLYMIIKR